MIISFQDVSYTYWQADKPALQNICLQIPAGQFVVLTGPTGAGKSTFLKMLNGLIPNHIPGKLNGEVMVCGKNTRQHSVANLSRQVGIVFEDPDTQIVSLSVEDDVAFGPSNLGLTAAEIRASIASALEKTRLLGFESRNPFNLSGGEKQSLAMAGVLAMQPEILALDEPTSMLDPIGRARIISILKDLAQQANKTILVVEQNPELIIDLADRILLFDKGRIVRDGSPQELFSDVDTLRRVGAKLPPVAEVFSELERQGCWSAPLPLTVPEAVALLKAKIRLNGTHAAAHQIDTRSSEQGNDAAVNIQKLEHDFGDGVMALKKINLQFHRATTTAIIGQNGSGKSTLAFHMVGILAPTNADGRLTINGLDVQALPVAQLIRHVNYVFQNPDDQLFQESVIEEIDYGLKNLGIPKEERKNRIDWVVERFGLQDYVDESPKSLSRSLRTKAAIAAIVAMKPDVLVVDEPTTGLDRRESLEIMQVLEKLTEDGTTVIFISHEMDLVAQFARRAVVMHGGKILIEGPTEKVFTEADILQQASLSPPDIHRLAFELGWKDLGGLRTPQDMAILIAKMMLPS